jgi:sarcosine oxidase
MMARAFDVVVVGLGAAGSAALCHLARSGAAVAGFDAFSPPHARGSSHGETRMIREAYYEDPRYVPLIRRAYDLWHELAATAGETLITETGGAFAGPPDGDFIAGIRRSAHEHRIAIGLPSREDAQSRFPWLSIPQEMSTVTEPRAGLLNPEACVAAHLAMATARGADVHLDEPVAQWSAHATGVVVETSRARYRARRLVVCTGAWMTETLASAGVRAEVTRQILFWFRPRARDVAAGLPVWAVEFTPGKLLYGFPDRGAGIKVAVHYGGSPTTPEAIDRTVRDDEWHEIEGLLARYAPTLAADRLHAAVCMYTNTPDQHFVIDVHPRHDGVLLVSACSGHGFKFASAVGEAAAQWVLEGKPKLDLSLFAISRSR